MIGGKYQHWNSIVCYRFIDMSPQTGVPQESFHHSPLCSYHKSAKSAQNKTKRQLLVTIGEFKKVLYLPICF